jgi:ribosome-associated heat shock protein Hsp15
MRIDKFIWCVRLSKTRSLATKLCNADKVVLNDDLAKSSKSVRVGDEISLKFNPIWRSFKVLDIPKSRLGAKLVPDYLEETTEASALATYERVKKENRGIRQRSGKGRPTKKDRRDMNRFKEY